MKEAACIFAFTVSLLSGLLFLGDFAHSGYLNVHSEEAILGVFFVAMGVTGVWTLWAKRAD